MPGVLLFGLLLAGAPLPTKTVTLSPASLGRPVRVSLPIGKTSRIVFPEPSVSTLLSRGTAEEWGLQGERSRPLAMVAFTPRAAGLSGLLEFHGSDHTIRVELRSVEAGDGYEMRLVFAP